MARIKRRRAKRPAPLTPAAAKDELVVAIYLGPPPVHPKDYPFWLKSWAITEPRIPCSTSDKESLRKTITSGEAFPIVFQGKRCTIYAVVPGGRVERDIKRAILATSRSAGRA